MKNWCNRNPDHKKPESEVQDCDYTQSDNNPISPELLHDLDAKCCGQEFVEGEEFSITPFILHHYLIVLIFLCAVTWHKSKMLLEAVMHFDTMLSMAKR